MDPVQLQLMQQMGMGQVPGIPGTQAPLTIGGGGGGASRLSSISDPRMSPYVRPIAENPMPDISPLAPIQPMLNRFGVMGAVAGIAGNAAMTSMMQNAGVMPMGNAGSYMQAYRTRQFQEMQRSVSAEVADKDAEGIYRTFRGGAALMGMPFNREQREAARSMANTIADFGPMLAMAAPELLDAMSGERGSVQAMAGQMMQANRYRIDPLTGQMGYGAEANADLVGQTFDKMFAGDNMARMQGLRAGDMGQLYRRLAPEGLVGPQESLRDRTLVQLNAAREAGQLDAIGAEAGVDVEGNLAALSNEDLMKLRETSSMRSRMTDADSRKIAGQLQDYVGTLSALREVFGENGNPNAPIPQLINALEALTSGQMHKFDAARLNTMVRDMQSLSQMSGKSIDQFLAMNQAAAAEGQQLGIGTTFAPTATNVSVMTGMAFQERGGATGFGALSREEAEQAGMSLFNRGMASEMGNTLGALGRIEEAGGFADNAAGRRLESIMEAARAGETTYIDPETGEERNLPTQEAGFRALITAGGVDGMSRSDFNMMLGDRTSNLRMMSSDPELQQAAFNNQSREINKLIGRQVGNRLSTAEPLMDEGLSAKDRNTAARAMGTAATAALADLSPAEIQDTDVRNRAIADALMTEAGNQGITLTEQEALTMSTGVFGQAENGARRFGFESYTAFSQVMGDDVTEVRKERSAQARARAGVNDAMSGLGPQGTIMQRFFTALQNQGDRGGEANLNTVLQDMFGADMDQARDQLMPELQAVADEKDAIAVLQGELEGASPEKRRELQREIQTRTAELKARVLETREIGKSLGIGGGEETFDLEDVATSRKAARNLENFNRMDQVRLLSASGQVTGSEREDIADTELSVRDLRALGVEERKRALVAADEASAGDIEKLPEDMKQLYDTIIEKTGKEEVARKRVQQEMRDQVGSSESFAQELSNTYRTLSVGDLDEAEQDIIVRGRRSTRTFAPTASEIQDRLDLLNEAEEDRPATSSLPTRAERKAIQQEIEQLEAERDVDPEQRTAIERQIKERKAELGAVDPERQEAITREIAALEAELAGPTDVQREEISEGIETRRDDLLDQATPEQQALIQQIGTLSASLPEATAERQVEIKAEIEARKAELGASLSEPQLKLAQEIATLKGVIDGPTAGQQAEITREIEARKAELSESPDDRQARLSQEVASLETAAAGPTEERRSELTREIEDRKAELSEAPVAAKEALTREIVALEAERDGPTAEQQAELQSELAKRKVELSEVTGQNEQRATEAEAIENQVARSFGFESYAAFKSATYEEATPERRTQIAEEIAAKKAELDKPSREAQEDEDYAQTLIAEEQILAERQLQSLGMLSEGQTLLDDVDDFEGMSDELKEQLEFAKPEDKAGIVNEYLDSQVRQQFYGTEEEIELARVAANEQLGTAEGQRSLGETVTNLATMADARREFLLDEGASTRLGSSVTLEAVKQSRAAELNLQQLGNDYFSGSPERLLVSSGLAMDAEGAALAEKRFGELTDEERTDVAARLSEAGTEVKAADLSVSDYKAYIGLKGKDYVQEMEDANETLAGGANQTAMAERLGVSKDELGSLLRLTSLESADVKEQAKKLGMTEEQYQAIVEGDEEIDPNLRLFTGEDAEEQLKTAKSEERKLRFLQVSLDKTEATLAEDAERDPDGVASPQMLKKAQQLRDRMAPMQARQDERMRAAGLDPEKKEDIAKYQQRLTNQGSLQALENRREEYMAERKALSDGGMSEEDIDEKLGTMKAEEIKAREDLKAFRALDLGDAGNAIAEGFGIEAGVASDELSEFKKTIEGGGEAQGRNLKMVAGVLAKIEDLDIGDADATSIEKLDELTDEYDAADAAGRKKMAMKYGMQVSDLDTMMAQTDFMGMELTDEKYGQDRFDKALTAVGGKDIAAEVAEEEERQMKITGTVNVTGVVTGEGTFEDVVGATVR